MASELNFFRTCRGWLGAGLLALGACGPGKAETHGDGETGPEPLPTCMGNLSCSGAEDPCAGGACSTTCDDSGCGVPTEGCPFGDCSTCSTEGCGGPTAPDPTTGPAVEHCPPESGDLAQLWSMSDGNSERGEAVAVADGRVAWLAGDFTASHLRVHDLEANELWAVDGTLTPGEGERTLKDLAFDADGDLVVVGTTTMGQATVTWHGPDGAPVGASVEPASELAGVALLADGSVAVVGSADDDMRVTRYDAVGSSAWTRSFADMGAAWSSDVAAVAGGLVVSGHSNTTPGPVVAGYDLEGTLLWSRVDPGGPLELGLAVAVDGAGRVFLAIAGEDATGRVERLGPDGAAELSIALDYAPRSLAVDLDDRLVIAGWRALQLETVVIERRDGDPRRAGAARAQGPARARRGGRRLVPRLRRRRGGRRGLPREAQLKPRVRTRSAGSGGRSRRRAGRR